MSFFDYPTSAEPDRSGADYLLSDATDGEWSALIDHTRALRFAPGEAVVSPGSPGRSLFLVIEGTLEVLVDQGRRRARRVAVLGAGAVIGELAFFDGGARSALVRAVSEVDLAELSPAGFDALAADRPELARRLLLDLGRILARRLRATQQSPSDAGMS